MGTQKAAALSGAINQDFYLRMLGFVSRRVSNREDAEEITQEIFFRLIKYQSSLKEERVTTWVYVTAKNAIIDFYRKKSVRQTQALTDDDGIEETFNEDEGTNEVAYCLSKLIERLPEKEASLLKVIDLEGGSQRELAKKLNIPYSTLKSKIQKSRKNLKKELFNCCKISLDSRGSPAGCCS